MDQFCYNVTGFQRHLWDYHKMTDGAARQADTEGVDRYAGFKDFSAEIYHRLFAEHEAPMDEPAVGSDVFQKFHSEMGKLPELEDLKARCVGNERWSGIGTSSMIDTLLSAVEAPEKQVEDLRGEEETGEYLRRLLERTKDEDEAERLQEMLDEHGATAPGRIAANAKAADMADATEIRSAIRKATQAANDAIDTEERIMNAFGCGDDQHSGQRATMKAGRELSRLVSKSERLRKIADLAGRLRRIAQEEQRQKPREGTDEVAGIELGRDLSKMVPTEGFFMAPEVEGVFARRFAEGTLTQIEMSKTPPKQQGPIVMLLDSSGSMSYGDADVWAAAVCLSFLEIAKAQGRAFSVVHFGRSVLRVDTFEGKAAMKMEAILDTVQFFASDGGTNFMEPLDAAVEQIKTLGEFNDADVVMVTDGNAPVNDLWLTAFKAKQIALDFDVYSILVGDSTDIETTKRFSTDSVLLDDVLHDDSSMHKFFGAV